MMVLNTVMARLALAKLSAGKGVGRTVSGAWVTAHWGLSSPKPTTCAQHLANMTIVGSSELRRDCNVHWHAYQAMLAGPGHCVVFQALQIHVV